MLVRPLLCRFFPTAVTMQLVATATTDECGHFRTFFFRGCNNPDTPDLYFKAKQRIFPAPFLPLVILAPTPIACHTRWNYACGSEVTLYTSHPLAITCSPCPPVIAEDNWVLVMAVGNHPLSRIRGTSSALQATTNPGNLGLTDLDAPWGGLLRLRLEFDNSLRESLGVKYYQVSWRAGTSGAFQPLSGDVHRHYTRSVGGPVPGSPPVIETVTVLLGGCAVAGFSENLYVAATATDGWRRLSEYDRSAVRAFVLAPQEN